MKTRERERKNTHTTQFALCVSRYCCCCAAGLAAAAAPSSAVVLIYIRCEKQSAVPLPTSRRRRRTRGAQHSTPPSSALSSTQTTCTHIQNAKRSARLHDARTAAHTHAQIVFIWWARECAPECVPIFRLVCVRVSSIQLESKRST